MAEPLVAVIPQRDQPVEGAVLALFENPGAGLLGPLQFARRKGKAAKLADQAVRRLCVRVFQPRNLGLCEQRDEKHCGQRPRYPPP